MPDNTPSGFVELNHESKVVGLGSGNPPASGNNVKVTAEDYGMINHRFLTHSIYYDFIRQTFTYSPNMEYLKENVKLAINAWLTREVERGFLFNGKMYGCSSYDQQNITAMYLNLNMAEATGQTSFWYKSADHTEINLSREGVELLFKAMHDSIINKLAIMNTYKKSLDGIETEKALEDFKIIFLC
jgi:hypothetical protein